MLLLLSSLLFLTLSILVIIFITEVGEIPFYMRAGSGKPLCCCLRPVLFLNLQAAAAQQGL